jgi:hypothetical protein
MGLHSQNARLTAEFAGFGGIVASTIPKCRSKYKLNRRWRDQTIFAIDIIGPKEYLMAGNWKPTQIRRLL